ncbi:MAG: energy coupling factor transporter S component ThiW [Tissierellia bacterium]|nr:energy coupling factor transporter S component ThiW [Tissierellia bacterium]
MNKKTRDLTFAAILVAIGVSLSFLYIPVGVAKCFPIQHMVNVIAAVILGPLYAVLVAFSTSFIRVIMSTGSLLAFPGSMFGAFFSAMLYKRYKKLNAAVIGEIFGTGIIGALAAYPIAKFIMGREAAIFAFVIPFGISTIGGSIIATVLLLALEKTVGIENLRGENI